MKKEELVQKLGDIEWEDFEVKDRIEFMNHGSLPAPVEVLRRQELSLPRNPILIKIFRILKLAENAGYGFDKMFKGWNKQYNLKPIIDGDFDYYKITFPKDKSGTTINTITYATTKTTTKGDDKEKEILDIIENNPSLSVEQISGLVNLSIDGVRYHVKNLKKKERIKRKGHGKGGSWEVLA